MKKYRYLLIVMFAMFVLLPFIVNAEVKEIGDKVYTIETKKIEDYVCEELKGHNFEIGGSSYNSILIYDENNDKEYLIDFSKKGVCEEFSGDFLDEDYVPVEFVWEGNELYLETYNSNVIYEQAITLDKELDYGSEYAEKKDDGYYIVDNPVEGNLSNYYELYLFDLAKGEYDEEAQYYEIVKYKYLTWDGYFSEAVSVQLDETTYEANKYYVFAQPEKKELLTTIEVEEFIVPKDKSGLENDLTLTKADFSYFMEFGNKKYLLLYGVHQNSPFVAYFDEKGNYQTFGLDTLLIRDGFATMDNEYLSFRAVIENKDNLILLDKSLNLLFMYDVSELNDMPMFIGYEGNTFYYLANHFTKEIFEVNTYYLISEDNQKFANKDLTFKFSGALDKVKTVKLYDENKVEVELSEDNYVLSSGSTIITLKKEYLNALQNGTYNLKVEYKDGGYSTTTFVKEIDESSNQGTAIPENPQTFDGIERSIFVGIVSLIGLISTIIYLKRRNKEKSN